MALCGVDGHARKRVDFIDESLWRKTNQKADTDSTECSGVTLASVGAGIKPGQRASLFRLPSEVAFGPVAKLHRVKTLNVSRETIAFTRRGSVVRVH